MLELHGVVHGRTIELQEDLGLPDGEAVKVVVRRMLPQGSRVLPPGEGIRRSAGAWADSGEEELDRWLEGVYRDRDNDRQEPKP